MAFSTTGSHEIVLLVSQEARLTQNWPRHAVGSACVAFKKTLNGKLHLTGGVRSGGKAGLCGKEEENDGPANPQTRSAVHSYLEATSADLSPVWPFRVDRVQQPAEGRDFGGDFPAQDSHQSMPHPHVCSLSCALSPRRRGMLGLAAWRIWPGCHCAHWLLALQGTSLRPRDAPAGASPAGW